MPRNRSGSHIGFAGSVEGSSCVLPENLNYTQLIFLSSVSCKRMGVNVSLYSHYLIFPFWVEFHSKAFIYHCGINAFELNGIEFRMEISDNNHKMILHPPSHCMSSEIQKARLYYKSMQFAGRTAKICL